MTLSAFQMTSRGRGRDRGRGAAPEDTVPEIPGLADAMAAFAAQFGGQIGAQLGGAPPHPPQPRKPDWLERVSKTRVPTYDGEADPAALERYIVEHEKAFEAIHVPADQRIRHSSFPPEGCRSHLVAGG